VRQFRTLLALLCVLLGASLVALTLQAGPQRLAVLTVLAIYLGLLALQFYALGWAGMWCVVKAPELKQPRRVSSNAFFFIVMLPGIMFGFIVVSVQFLCWLAGLVFSPRPQWLVPFFFSLAFANSVYWLRRAKRELPHELRLFAFRRYTPREPVTFFGRMGKMVGHVLRRARARPVVT